MHIKERLFPEYLKPSTLEFSHHAQWDLFSGVSAHVLALRSIANYTVITLASVIPYSAVLICTAKQIRYRMSHECCLHAAEKSTEPSRYTLAVFAHCCTIVNKACFNGLAMEELRWSSYWPEYHVGL